MTRSSNPSRELADLRDRRIELKIAITVLEEKGAKAAAIEPQRAALLTLNARIAELERARKFGNGN
jgi:hypothetical protein